MEEVDYEDETEDSIWAETSPGVFGATMPSHGPALPPGIYTIGQTMDGQIRFKKCGDRDEPLMRFPGLVDDIMKEVQYFWSRREVYAKLQLPYRRGILLYGPPGTGKSSVVRLALDDVVARGGVGFIFENLHLLTNGYNEFRSIQPNTPAVVVIEDLEAHCRDSYSESGLINFLDGVTEGVDNTIFIATTNYIDNLSDRVANRPSRFDKKFEIGFPPAAQRAAYMKNLLDSIPPGLDTFENVLHDVGYARIVADTHDCSLAHIKELFIAVAVMGADYDEIISALKPGGEAVELDDSPPKGRVPARKILLSSISHPSVPDY